MRVALAYPYDGHPPDAVVDLERRLALRLIGEGRARRAPELEPTAPPAKETEATQYSTVSQLRAYAAAHGIELPKRAKRTELLEVILETEKTRATETETPGTGDQQ